MEALLWFKTTAHVGCASLLLAGGRAPGEQEDAISACTAKAAPGAQPACFQDCSTPWALPGAPGFLPSEEEEDTFPVRN